MERIKVLIYGVLLATIGFWGICYFTNNVYSSDLNEKDEINTILSQLKDSDYRVRDKALWKLLNPRSTKMGETDSVKEEYRNNERVRSALINLLDRELKQELNWKVKRAKQEPLPPESYGEAYGEYVSALTQAVVSLKDKRALPYLLDWACYEYIQDYIIEAGDESVVRKCLKDLENIDPVYPVRTKVSVEILGRMVKKEEGYIPTETTREEIKQAIVRTLKQCKHIKIDKRDPYSELNSRSEACIRQRAIRALGNFEDPGFIPIIKPYLNDPYSETREKTELRQEGKKATVVKLGKVTIYPVREEAQRVIKLLEEKKKQKENEGKKAPKGKKELQEGVNDKKGKK